MWTGPPWKSQSERQMTGINGESTSMVWPTLGSRTAKEQQLYVILTYTHPELKMSTYMDVSFKNRAQETTQEAYSFTLLLVTGLQSWVPGLWLFAVHCYCKTQWKQLTSSSVHRPGTANDSNTSDPHSNLIWTGSLSRSSAAILHHVICQTKTCYVFQQKTSFLV